MTLEHIYGGGAAWMSYRIYESGLWPLGTFLSGVEGLSLFWPTIGAIPIYAIEYSLDRRRQATKQKPVARANSALVCAMSILVPMLGLYYAGYAITYFWS